MARKKIVFVIVEGSSDDTALGVALNQVYNKDSVYVHIMHGDITTERGVTPENIITKVGNAVRNYAKSNHYKAKDFKQIIHIVDTDGVYLADDKIMEDQTCQEIRYESDGIYTKNPQGIRARNEQKRDNLFRLRSNGRVWNIPYRVYYMSCNLDHVLHNKRNSTEEEKENDSYAFAKKYKDRVEDFIHFICESSFSLSGDFKKSWEHIERGMNSIERYTNLGICLEDEIESQKLSETESAK